MLRSNRGFSLVEMMVVVVILGILASVAVPTYMGIQKRSKRSEFRANLEILRLLEEKHRTENGTYAAAATTDELKALFYEFKPGATADLYYDYSVVCPTSQSFVVSATGKPGTHDDGVAFTVDQDNNRVGW